MNPSPSDRDAAPTPSRTPTSSPGPRSVWARAGLAILAALGANLVLWWAGVTLLAPPPEFLPLAGPGPTIFFTLVGAVPAVLVYAALRRASQTPDRLFRRIAIGALLLSLVPDLWLLTEGGSAAIPGATPGGVALLMLMHAAAAGAIVVALTGSLGRAPERVR